MNSSPIIRYLVTVRRQLAQSNLIGGIQRYLTVLLPLVLGLLIAESIFYFEPAQRTDLLVLSGILLGLWLFYLLLRWLINRNGWLKNSMFETIAGYIGSKVPGLHDRLLNAYQLEKTIAATEPGNDLALFAVNKMAHLLETLPAASLKEKAPLAKLYRISAVALGVLLIFGVFQRQLLPAAKRLAHPQTVYPVPIPFTLESLTGSQEVLGGDSLTVVFGGEGELPDSLTLKWRAKSVDRSLTVPLKEGKYSYQFVDLNSDLIYYSEVVSTDWFSPWGRVSTDPDTIFVTGRPIVDQLEFTIVPPPYTGDAPWVHPGNVTDVTILAGSRVQISGAATKPLSMAWALVGTDREDLAFNHRQLSGSFTLEEDQAVSIYCLDENNVANLNPAQYRFTVLPDFPPDLLIAAPDREISLDESLAIDFNIQTSDDYGYSAAALSYRLKHPDYLTQDTTVYTHAISELIPSARSQQIFHTWDLSELNLSPEDELEFQIKVTDNNTLTGPGITSSGIFIARYPSLEDLFQALSASEETTQEESMDLKMSLEDVKDLVEELNLEMLKSDEVNWEQQQKSEDILNKMDDITEQIQDMQESLQKAAEQMEKNNLIDKGLQEKFSQLQDLLDQVLTPELQAAMDKLREAMEKMDPQKMQQALENFDMNVDELKEQLDRFIDMFQQAMAEQRMDEVVKRLEEMVAEQNEIVDELKKDDGQTFSELASRERLQEENFSRLDQVMQDASQAMEQYARQPAQELSELQKSELAESANKSLTEARKKMQKSDPGSNTPASSASESLSEMLEKAQMIQEQFQQQTVAEMMKDFQRVLHNTLAISSHQEALSHESKGLRSNSPKLPEITETQDRVRRRTNQLFAQLMELSRKTFYISPKINQTLGKAQVSMDKSISKLEQKQISSAISEQKKATRSLNEAARLMLDAMDKMQSSGSASGFDSFMEQMEQMSQQQQGINQGTMQLGQMGMMAQQAMMQRLQGQQQALQKSLNELLSEMPGEEDGGLGKASQDMEEVIKDFKRRQVTRATQDRQERILSRMLDSQKSMTQRDYSKKRKSKAGEEMLYTGPAGLPEGLGERDLLLIKAMEDALKEGYSREYQNMMKTYFRELQKHARESDTGVLEN